MANPTSSVATSVNTSGAKVVTTTTYTYSTSVVAKTASYQVLAADDGTWFTTRAAGGEVDFTLPPLQAGLAFKFTAVAAFVMKVIAPGALILGCGGAAFVAGTAPGTVPATSLSVAGGTAADINTTLTIQCDGTNWFVTNIQGGGITVA